MSLLATVSGMLAQSSYYTTYDDASGAAAAGFVGMFWLIYCCAILVGLLSLVFTVWMIIDVLKRSDAEEPNKVMWVLIMFFLSPIGALVYFFTERKKLNSGKATK